MAEAEALFAQHQHELSAVALDACLGSEKPNTLDLARLMRQKGFQGPLIACSAEPDYRQELMQAGCDRECDKFELAQFLRTLLKLN